MNNGEDLYRMELQTKIKINPQDNPIDYDSKLVLLGSCFAENIGEKLRYYKFQNTVNPFGVLFHPKAIERLVVNAVSEKKYNNESVFYHNERWQCYESHSKLSHPDKSVLLSTLNENIENTNARLREASHLIITLGTAWVYRLKENGTIVANCHKVPQRAFDKELLSVNTILESLQVIVNAVQTINLGVSITFSVSPIRHIKDGFIENTRSKAHLISAIHYLINDGASSSNTCNYFPSFEIVMDELRDYRFYREDMLHPNNLTINYIWEQYKRNCISDMAIKIMEEVEEIQKGLSHVPFNPNSEGHIKFVKALKKKQEAIREKITHIAF